MSRNRITYSSSDVLISDYPGYASQTGTYSLKLLKRVQSCSIGATSAITRSKQISNDDFVIDKYIQYPQVSIGIDYLLSDNSNELLFNLAATGNVGILSQLNGTGKDRNLFLLTSSNDFEDAHNLTTMVGNSVSSFGNAFLTNYSVKVAVGDIPSATVSFDCLNAVFESYSASSQVPSINLLNGTKSTNTYFLTGTNLTQSNYLSNQGSRASALRPGDISLQFEQPVFGGVKYSGAAPILVTSFDINLQIERKDLLDFGTNYPRDKRIIFPLIGQLNLNGTVDNFIDGSYTDIFTDENEYNFNFSLKKNDGTTGLYIQVLGAKIDSQNMDLNINKQLSFSSQFSFKVSQQDGLRISGESRLLESLEA